jgi:NADP-dependent 3-hydroxy acid dehydrogenase YdfG
MSKQMLIIGSNGGVGKECVKYFSTTYDVVSISREQGDLRDKDFLQTLVDKYNPSVVLNCAGVYKKEFYETFETNFLSVSFLTLEFYKKMKGGHIINVCSSGANSTGWKGIDYERVSYNISKRALKSYSNMLQLSKNKSVKVSTIEPAQINTSMGDKTFKGNIDESQYEKQTEELVPMKPSYIAKVVDWILNQPDPVVISSIEIQNFIVSKE